MSIFNWFSSKESAKKVPPDADTSGLGHIDATIPFQPSDRRVVSQQPVPGGMDNRRSERMERRELLYAVVRESMVGVGVLSSKYKFKVLSLDSRGNKYLIMMDLSKQFAPEPHLLGDIEALIAQNAKARHNILVTSVYWRVSEQVSAGLAQMPRVPSASQAQPTPSSKPQFEPVMPNEVEAFKQALSAVPGSPKLASPGEIVRSGKKKPAPAQSFADTEMLEDPHMPLSGTQYGELN